jgi:hypothetical protein
VGNTDTKWDQLQSRFKNSWLGLALLTVIALVVAATQLGDSTKKLIEWVRPIPAPQALIQSVSVEPLPQYRDWPRPTGAAAIYPGGAIVRFVARHDGKGDDGEKTINLYGLDLKVTHDPQIACPFKPTGDDIRGAGEGPLREFIVLLSNGKVEAVQRKEQRSGPVARGRSDNLLELEPRFPLVLRKGEDPEQIIVNVAAVDLGHYQVGLSMRYTSRTEVKTADITSVSFCKPQR